MAKKPSASKAEDAQIGKRLRELRNSRGLSMKDVAAALEGDVHFTTIAKLETGRMRLTYDWLDRLLQFYDVEMGEFLQPFPDPTEARLIPLYNGPNWPPSPQKPWPQFGVVAIAGGGPNCVAVEFFDLMPDLAADVPFYAVIFDLDDTELMEGAVFTYRGASEQLQVGVYRAEPSRLIPFMSRMSLIAELDSKSPDRVEIVGRVISINRRFDSGFS